MCPETYEYKVESHASGRHLWEKVPDGYEWLVVELPIEVTGLVIRYTTNTPDMDYSVVEGLDRVNGSSVVGDKLVIRLSTEKCKWFLVSFELDGRWQFLN